MRSLIFFTLVLFSLVAQAGIMELSASYGVRTSKIDADNYTRSESWSSSLAWYFWEKSALEVSYSQGRSVQSLKAVGTSTLIYTMDSEVYGADLVITLAGKDSFIQPFIRGGVAHLKKKIYRTDTATGAVDLFGAPVDGVVPTYGAGLNIRLTTTFSLKFSYDRIRSGVSNDSNIWDEAAKAGLSWYF